jgi:PiT family inorganic phosphate transporter
VPTAIVPIVLVALLFDFIDGFHDAANSIAKLRPIGGVCAETAGALTLIGTAPGGIPVSATQTLNGSIMGVGAIQRLSAVRWGAAGRILWARLLTIPASVLVAGAARLRLRVLVA